MKKRFLSVFAFLFWTLCANATAQYMTVELKSGDKFSFLLEDNPVVTFKKGDLVVNGNAETSSVIATFTDLTPLHDVLSTIIPEKRSTFGVAAVTPSYSATMDDDGFDNSPA